MPKLDDSHLVDRLRKRISELEAGEEVAAKDIRAVLTDEQMAALDAAWGEQQQLRKGKRATTEEQQRTLGWKTKREVRLEIFALALADANRNLLNTFEELQQQATVKQGRIYFDTYGAARDAGYEEEQAKAMANRALTQAGLARMDGHAVGRVSKRDEEIEEFERQFRRNDDDESAVGKG